MAALRGTRVFNFGAVIIIIMFRWAMADGYGAQLMSEPELVADMVRQAKARSGLPVSVKMRIHKNLK